MPKITIDGQMCEFDDKMTILQVALANEVSIPYYCYHPALSIVASCRICLAEIEAPDPRHENKIELIPKLMPTCQTLAADGMHVHTRSPKAVANQKSVMEYLLINHPLDCPVCDQAGECYLQDYSYQYGRASSRFEEDKIKQPKKDIGPHVLLYADRCIMCSRCVRFTQEVTGTAEIGVFGRGNQEQIDIFPGHPLDNEISANVVDICPVGALLDKDFLMTMRVWNLSSTPSIDGITASGDNINIEWNEDRIYRIKPRTNMDVNKWWISDHIRYGWRFVHREDRLRSPKRMQLGTQVECDWKRAYEDVHDHLRRINIEKDPGGLAVIVSPMLSCEETYLLGTLVRRIDPQAMLAVGPVPTDGEDKTFPGGYTIYAEKCPNARGVRRALELVAGDSKAVLTFDDAMMNLADKACNVATVFVTGNYPDAWTSDQFVKALAKKFVILIDTLPNGLTAKANILLPGGTWAEKAGTFENANSRLQSFQQAIRVIELAKCEGQIALDLMATLGQREPSRYKAEAIRAEMGGAFISDVHQPVTPQQREPDMQYIEL